MQLRNLQAFVTLAREMNYRRAAQRLLISQPGLTDQIRCLERDLGVRLFERDRAGTRLSPQGRRLLPLAVTAADAVRDVVDAAGGRPGVGVRRRRLTVGLFIDGASELTWPVLEAFCRARPDVDLVLRPLSFADTFSAVRNGDVDVMLLRGPVSPEDVEIALLGWCPVVVAMGAGHAFAAAATLDVRDVVGNLAFDFPPGLDPVWRSFWLQKDLHDDVRPHLRLEARNRTDLLAYGRDVARAGTVALFPVGSPISLGPDCVHRPLRSPLHAPTQAVCRPHDADAMAFLEMAAHVSATLLPMCRYLVASREPEVRHQPLPIGA